MLTLDDDRFHPPSSNDPWWSETCWFSFAHPEARLSGSFYPLFRANQGVCSLAVSVWDADAHEPWRLAYHRCDWHLPLPATNLDRLALGALRYEVLEPRQRYRVRYQDGERFCANLEYTGLIPVHEAGIRDGHGHVDQPCHVRGEIVLRGRRIAIDAPDMRDRSWGVRRDDRSTRSAYCYAIAGAAESFLAVSFASPGLGGRGDVQPIVAGFLVRGGEKAALVAGTRTITRDGASPWPARVAIEARDALGRELNATGVTVNRFANQASPGLFAWMSLTRWDFAGESFGQDQDIGSPDRL
ncbi:MAG TPA: hypothetical protein VFT98_12920 [Myxococcota bacterium]|nr:hypothetical protein [Myxococcota bacterium]